MRRRLNKTDIIGVYIHQGRDNVQKQRNAVSKKFPLFFRIQQKPNPIRARVSWRDCGGIYLQNWLRSVPASVGMPLRNIEKGGPSVAIGSYATVLHALHGMDKDLLLIESILLTRILLVSLRTPHRTGGGAC